jgi:beta-1,4-mannosyl-glycoprotein beta-1,4-N-acetylglucosaminyltransferase
MGGVERIRQKIAASAHQEFNQPQFTDPQLLSERIQRGESLFGHDERLAFVPLDDSFPAFVREHPEKFSAWIKPL